VLKENIVEGGADYNVFGQLDVTLQVARPHWFVVPPAKAVEPAGNLVERVVLFSFLRKENCAAPQPYAGKAKGEQANDQQQRFIGIKCFRPCR